jgi:predicted RecB family endonuclease
MDGNIIILPEQVIKKLEEHVEKMKQTKISPRPTKKMKQTKISKVHACIN